MQEKRSIEQIKLTESLELEEKELSVLVGNFIDSLPTKKKEILIMRYFDDMSYKQIALHFKSSEDGIRKMI